MSGQSTIFSLFFGHDIKTEVGVVVYIYLIYFPDHTDSKYIWVQWSNSLGSSVFAEIPFLAFLAFHTGKGDVARWDSAITFGQNDGINIHLLLYIYIGDYVQTQRKHQLVEKNTEEMRREYNLEASNQC